MADAHEHVTQASSTDDQLPPPTASISERVWKYPFEAFQQMMNGTWVNTKPTEKEEGAGLVITPQSSPYRPEPPRGILRLRNPAMNPSLRSVYSFPPHREDYQTQRFNLTQNPDLMMEQQLSSRLFSWSPWTNDKFKRHQDASRMLEPQSSGNVYYYRTLMEQSWSDTYELAYKESIKWKYEFENQRRFPPEPPLAALYTEPVIVQKNEKGSFCKVSVEELFKSDMHLYDPETVILQGTSGCGKSFLSQKIILDWAFGKRYLEHFNLAFYLRCDELKCISEEMNLIELLSRTCYLPSDQINQLLHNSTQRVLFIIDGLDQLTFMHYGFCTSKYEKAPPEVIVCSILRKQILSRSFLLITSKTEVPQGMLHRRLQRFSKIMGFSEKGVEKYFQKFSLFRKEEELFKKAYECVRVNEKLITACSIPVICWIICTVMRETFNEGADATRGLETTTSIYVGFVSTLLEHHCQGLTQSVPTLLRNLGQLAERGMLGKRVLFQEKTVCETVLEPVHSPILSKFLFWKIIHQERMFSFMHQSVQEFFTALNVLLGVGESQRKVREMLETVERGWALSCWSERANLEENLLQPVIEFLCGLCKNKWISSLFGIRNMAVLVKVETQLKEWISQCSQRYQNEHMLFILHCLYELHEKSFTGKVLEVLILIDLSNTPLKITDCWVLKYCLQCCEHIRNLKLYVASDNLKMLEPELYRCKELCIKVLGNDGGDPEIFVSIRDRDVMLSVSPSRSTSPVTELKITRSAFSTMDWGKLKKNLRTSIRHYQAEEADHLFAFLKSLSDVKEVHLHLLQLTRTMGKKILSLIQACPSLDKLRINVENQLMSTKIQRALDKSGWTMTVWGKTILIERYKERFEWKDLMIFRSMSESVRSGFSSSQHSLCSSDSSLIAHRDEASSPQSSSEDTEVFTPDHVQGNYEDKLKTAYRFVCARAGEFQCSLTSLVFVMEGEGEVLYRVVSWDPRLLDGLGQMQPAGPLYNIDCFKGSISRLHLPHCEILSEENKDGLAVARLTEGNVEIMKPLQVTETHVVVNIKDLSHFGLLKKMIFPPSPIIAQVLLFLRPITVRCRKKILDVHLLPWNVKLSTVKEQHAENAHIKTSSKCSLTPGSTYSLCCEPEGCTIQPVIETFESNYGPNYHPTFEVLLDVKIEEIRLSLLHETSEIWEPRLILLTGQDVEPPANRRLTETEFVEKHIDVLIQRVSSVKALADSLLAKEMITFEKWSEVQAAEQQQRKMRLLFDALRSGGASVKAEFYRLLKENEPHLIDELESGPSGSQKY